MKNCFIYQPGGLGDILLTLKIGCHFSKLGYNVIWPVYTVYNNLNLTLNIEEKINFVDINSNFYLKNKFEYFKNCNFNEIIELDDILFIPLCNSSRSHKTSLLNHEDYKNMIGKFVMCDLESDGWQDCFELNRDFKKEEELFSKLNIQYPYHLVNKEFGTPPMWREILKKEIITPSFLNKIDMRVVEGYDIFSWLKIFENADMIDTVSTSNFFLFEKLNLKCIPTIYSRNHPNRSYEENFNWMKKISRKQYNFLS